MHKSGKFSLRMSLRKHSAAPVNGPKPFPHAILEDEAGLLSIESRPNLDICTPAGKSTKQTVDDGAPDS